MHNTINTVLRALSIAIHCGHEEDRITYENAYASLQQAVHAVQAHDAQLNQEGRSPEGSDYEHVLETFGIRQNDATAECGHPGRHVRLLDITEDESQIARQLLGACAMAADAVEVVALVVDPTDGFIGADDIAKMPAVLNLLTGHLDLIEISLGHPVLSLDDVATIYHRGRVFGVGLGIDSVPTDIERDAIPRHIRECGYRVQIDVTDLRLQQQEGGQ